MQCPCRPRRAPHDRSRRTALARACEHGHLEVAQALVAAGADPEATDCLGLSPVALAARSGHRVVVEYLRTLGASLGSGRLSVLSMAAARGQDLDWLLHLVWDQASLDHALAQSCRRRCLQSVRRLLAQGARANADLGEHDGPLACAVLGLDEDYSEPVELIELLLEHGADPEQQCQEGPLPELAFRYGFRTLAK